MSHVYTLEPPTAGKVILRTSLGDLDIELWPKEAPRAVRNFVQLCMEGYYDGTVFHRVIKDFMVQGGDPSGTGQGGESIYGRPFRDEFHSRLRFSHRGIVASANENAPNTNGSQFFFTLDKAPHLDRKATIFGKITGETIYNMARFNDVETQEDDRPVEPPILMRADVLWNPFDDIKPRVDREAQEKLAKEAAEKNKAAEATGRRAKRNLKLVSFGDEAEEEEEELGNHAGLASAHDVLDDSRLAKVKALEVVPKLQKDATKAPMGSNQEEEPVSNLTVEGHKALKEDSIGFAARMNEKIEAKRKALGSGLTHEKDTSLTEFSGGDIKQSSPASKRRRVVSRAEIIDDRLKSSAAVILPSKQLQVQDRELLTKWEARRAEYKERKRLGGRREASTMSKLNTFLKKIREPEIEILESASEGKKEESIEHDVGTLKEEGKSCDTARRSSKSKDKKDSRFGYSGQVDNTIDHRAYMPPAWRIDSYMDEATANDSLSVLRQHKLSFIDLSKDKVDAMSIKDSVDDYVVLDPLLEAGKTKLSKQEYQERKRSAEWVKEKRPMD